jgi:hypothetical protein
MQEIKKQNEPDSDLQEIKNIIKKIAKSQAETERHQQETDRQLKESQRQWEESKRLLIETMQKSHTDYEKRLARQAKMTNGVSESYSSFAEEYFYNTFFYGELSFFGEKFDDIDKNRTGKGPGEYDIMMFNCTAVAVIEVKFKTRDKHIDEVLNKEKTFRLNFPEYNSHKLYLGLAAMVFDPEIEKACIDEGIAVIKQVGNNVVINDKNVKAFVYEPEALWNMERFKI